MSSTAETSASLADLEINIKKPGFFLRDDYFDILRRLRDEAPCYEAEDGVRLISRYEDIRWVGTDTEAFTSMAGTLVNDANVYAKASPPPRGSLLRRDPPEHSEYRNILNKRFTPRAVHQFHDRVRALICDILDAAPRDTEIDFIDHIAAEVPVAVLSELLGVGEGDRKDFRRWTDAMIERVDHPDDQVLEADRQELTAFLDDLVARRFDSPTDDLISMLTGVEICGHAMSPGELADLSRVLIVAGMETSRHLISGGVQALAAHPDQRARLAADSSLCVGAVEEIARWVTPVQAFARSAKHDLELAGEQVAAGDFLIMLYASGNRDERAFGPTAGEFDIARASTNRNVAFGYGQHVCLGQNLARMEVQTFFDELLVRYPRFEVSGPATYVPSTMVRGAETLPVVLEP